MTGRPQNAAEPRKRQKVSMWIKSDSNEFVTFFPTT
jgi:hypothetical protein